VREVLALTLLYHDVHRFDRVQQGGGPIGVGQRILPSEDA
jgi:hypothetical protein